MDRELVKEYIMKRALVFVLAVLFLVQGVVFVACRKDNDNNGEKGDIKNIVDTTGRTVAVPKTVNKVHTDWVSGSILVMTLGATEKLACVSPWLDSDTIYMA
jgi:hypothetical protein